MNSRPAGAALPGGPVRTGASRARAAGARGVAGGRPDSNLRSFSWAISIRGTVEEKCGACPGDERGDISD
eukprot:1074064-Prorocentrum_minimum.AAC.1